MSRHRGLSLIEILVVIVIVAITVLLYLGLTQPGKTEYRTYTQCMAQLKTLTLAMHTYAYDHEDYFPGVDAQGHVISPQVTARFKLLKTYLDKPHMFVCPADSMRHQAVDFDNLSADNISYALLNQSRDEMTVGQKVLVNNQQAAMIPMISDRAIRKADGPMAVRSTHPIPHDYKGDWIGCVAWMDGHVSLERSATVRTAFNLGQPNSNDFLFDTHDASMVYRGKDQLIDPGHE